MDPDLRDLGYTHFTANGRNVRHALRAELQGRSRPLSMVRKWEVLDRVAYALMGARLLPFDLIQGSNPPIRSGDRKGPEALPLIDFGAFMAATGRAAGRAMQPMLSTRLRVSGACSPQFSPRPCRPDPGHTLCRKK
jgi:hypothetical protein